MTVKPRSFEACFAMSGIGNSTPSESTRSVPVNLPPCSTAARRRSPASARRRPATAAAPTAPRLRSSRRVRPGAVLRLRLREVAAAQDPAPASSSSAYSNGSYSTSYSSAISFPALSRTEDTTHRRRVRRHAVSRQTDVPCIQLGSSGVRRSVGSQPASDRATGTQHGGCGMPIAFRAGRLRRREHEIDVGDAHRAEVLLAGPRGAPSRALRGADRENEPTSEPGAQIRRRLECPNSALCASSRGRARSTASMTFAGSATSGGRILSSLGP